MNKVLLSNTYFLHFDRKQLKQMQPYAPLGTLYAASLLRQNGWDISLFDTTFRKSPQELLPKLQTEKPKLFIICDDGFNYLTKMCLTNMREAAFEMISLAKQHGCTVIVSSSDATDHFKEYLEHGADFIVKGEPEITLLELVKAIASGSNSYSSIQGLIFSNNNEISQTAPREVLHDLDSLSFPAWDLADLSLYSNKWQSRHGYFSMNMVTTRGCPFKCNWCAKPIYGNRYNSRSPENVVAEIKMLKEKYQPDHFWFCDDIFGLKPGWIKRFSELVQQEKLKFRFKIQCRADLLLQEENIHSLSLAGCDEIWIGAESGSQKILDAMEKGITVEQIHESTRLMRKHGIKPCFFLQFGYSGEEKKDIEATQKLLFDLMPHDIGISVSYPLPGTKFYEKVKDDLKTKSNWTDSDDLAMMYRGTYPPSFYKKLHRYIHRSFRSRQAILYFRSLISRPLKTSSRQLFRIAFLPYYFFSSLWYQRKVNQAG